MRSAQPRGWIALSMPALLAAVLSAGCGDTGRHATPGSNTATPPVARAAVNSAVQGPAPVTRSAPAPTVGSRPARPAATTQSPPAAPAIVQNPIPFGAARKAQMARYARRHYGLDTYLLRDPHVIVIHYTETPDFQSTFNTFAPDVRDSELHELPGTCAHFVIDKDGTIHQLVPLNIMCRHTVGLNWTAIGIEHVGQSDGEVLHRRRQMRASLSLVRWLRCRFHIRLADVIGHNESLSSPYHHENVPALRTQTHSDFNHADMNVYRSRLRTTGGC